MPLAAGAGLPSGSGSVEGTMTLEHAAADTEKSIPQPARPVFPIFVRIVFIAGPQSAVLLAHLAVENAVE